MSLEAKNSVPNEPDSSFRFLTEFGQQPDKTLPYGGIAVGLLAVSLLLVLLTPRIRSWSGEGWSMP